MKASSYVILMEVAPPWSVIGPLQSGQRMKLRRAWFQQEGATCHTSVSGVATAVSAVSM